MTSSTDTPFDVFTLIERGELPDYLCDLRKNETGIDPRTARKIFQWKKWWELLLFFLVCISVCAFLSEGSRSYEFIIPKKFGMASIIVGGTSFILLIVSLCVGPRLRSYYVTEFEDAIRWLLWMKPMTPEQFPQNDNTLRKLYYNTIIDMCCWILELERMKFKVSSKRARTHLENLVESAYSLTVLRREAGGLSSYFTCARTQIEIEKDPKYRVFSPQDWNRYHNPPEFNETLCLFESDQIRWYFDSKIM